MWHFDYDETPDHVLLTVSGSMDTMAAQDFDRDFDSRFPALDRDILADFSGLNYLNSTGLRSFLRIDKLVRQAGRKLTITGARERVIRIFEYCGLQDIFDFAPSEESPTLV